MLGTLVTVPLWLLVVGVEQLDHDSEGILAVHIYVSAVVRIVPALVQNRHPCFLQRLRCLVGIDNLESEMLYTLAPLVEEFLPAGPLADRLDEFQNYLAQVEER